ADMLVVAEEAAATAWDAAAAADGRPDEPSPPAGEGAAPWDPDRSLAAKVAGLVALDGFVRCAGDCVQVLGGIGFTWEHDAHIYLRRALAGRQLATGDGDLAAEVVGLALGGARRSLSLQLPPEADGLRATIGPLAESAARRSGDEQRRFLVDHGLLAPHWPAPWGRDAGPLEQLVIDEALSAHRVQRPGLAVGAWALPTLIAHGTPAQQERLVGPTLLGQLSWCQLFSEPGAGSDLASLTTRAERVDGGWRLNGQKVWTSLAQSADWGICLARTDPDVPKHEGITYFLVDMTTPGIDVRPLRELTGSAMFNEVFLDDVVVPDECVVGQPGQGWAIARTTLANERVFMSSGSAFGIGVESALRRLAELGDRATPAMLETTGHLLAEAQALRLMGHLATLRSLSGVDPGAGASVRKLLGAEHEQRVQELGLRLHGADGAVLDGEAQRWGHGFLATRCLTIAGGTSEVQRNVMAERLLGLPRDPEPGEGRTR
ncbi:MAG: acyl-CoA dehydrogenase family protein, partial [Acidimicrobiales bacterium]